MFSLPTNKQTIVYSQYWKTSGQQYVLVTEEKADDSVFSILKNKRTIIYSHYTKEQTEDTEGQLDVNVFPSLSQSSACSYGEVQTDNIIFSLLKYKWTTLLKNMQIAKHADRNALSILKTKQTTVYSHYWRTRRRQCTLITESQMDNNVFLLLKNKQTTMYSHYWRTSGWQCIIGTESHADNNACSKLKDTWMKIYVHILRTSKRQYNRVA